MADNYLKSVKGLESVLKKMEEITVQVTKKAVRGASSKAMRIARDAARANARRLDDGRTPEKIFKNIVISTKVYPQLGEVRSRVGVRGGARNYSAYGEIQSKGKGNPGGDTWYWRLLEFGTVDFAAKPFMRPALTENLQKITQEFVSGLNDIIDKAAKK